MLSQDFIDLLKALVRSPAVTGSEHSFYRVLQRELEERGAVVSWYEGVLVAQGTRPHSAMFSAHIDRHGLICTGPGEFQYAAFISGNRSDLLDTAVSEKLMDKITGRFNAESVFAYEPWSGVYRGSGVIRNSYICELRKNLIFEIDGFDGLVAGTPVAFSDSLKNDGKRLTAQLDNVLTAAVLVYLFELGFQGTAFFTAEEEAGKSWRYLLEWFRRFGRSTDRLFVLDTSPFDDEKIASQQQIVLRESDANATFSPQSTLLVSQLCQKNGFTYLFKDRFLQGENQRLADFGKKPRSLGATEMGRIVAASNGLVDGTTIQIPTTGYHTMQESASHESVETFIQLLLMLSESK